MATTRNQLTKFRQKSNGASLPDTTTLPPEQILGAGTSHICYKMNLNGTPVAIKVMKPGYMNSKHVRDKLDNEIAEQHRQLSVIETLTKHPHPNVHRYIAVGAYAVRIGDTDYQPLCWVSELLPGGDLQSTFTSTKVPPTWPVRISVMADIAAGVAHMHAIGTLHGDIKPHNVFVDANLRCKLADFDLSTHAKDKQIASGTPPYSAPELLSIDKISKSTDVYSTAITLSQVARWSEHARTDIFREGMPYGHVVAYIENPQLHPLPSACPKPITAVINAATLTFKPKTRPSAKKMHRIINAKKMHQAASTIQAYAKVRRDLKPQTTAYTTFKKGLLGQNALWTELKRRKHLTFDKAPKGLLKLREHLLTTQETDEDKIFTAMQQIITEHCSAKSWMGLFGVPLKRNALTRNKEISKLYDKLMTAKDKDDFAKNNDILTTMMSR